MRGPVWQGRRLASALVAVVVYAAGSWASPETPAARSDRWRRVYVDNPAVARALRSSLDGAGQRLEDAHCRSILSSPRLRDPSGRPLTDKLDALGMEPPEYLDVVVFLDGSAEPRCRAGALAFTAPGARVVYVCGLRFWRAWTERPHHTEAAVIHEALHTLGLGEDPPSSQFITQEVLAYCYR